MNILSQLVPTLYLLFTVTADALARSTCFVQRQRAFSGRTFLQTLVFGWLRRPKATLEDLAYPLGISKQALDQHFTQAAVAFAQAALHEALAQVVRAAPTTVALLQRWSAVVVDDCSQAWLPETAAAVFPGCGGNVDAPARMKILVRWELQRGQMMHLSCHPGRTADLTAFAQAPPLAKGSLHLADLAFLDLARLQQESDAGISWITRLPAHIRLFLDQPQGRRRRQPGDAPEQSGSPLWRQLRRWRRAGRHEVDLPARVGDKQAVSGRLLARLCPPEVVARRLAALHKAQKQRGRPVTERQRELCHWQVLFTNVSAEELPSEAVWLLYRLRWQIELLFKRFKSEGGWGQTRSAKRERVLVEWYLKLLGQVVRHWLELLSGGPLRRVNRVQLGRLIGDRLPELVQALRTGAVALWDMLWQLYEELTRQRPRTRRRRQQTAAELVEGMGRGPAGSGPRDEAGSSPAQASQRVETALS